MSFENPFTGSSLKVKRRLTEDEINFEFVSKILEKEDENERVVLFKDGTLVRKTKSETKYFP